MKSWKEKKKSLKSLRVTLAVIMRTNYFEEVNKIVEFIMCVRNKKDTPVL
jgi:hypothetical protein